MRHEHHRHHGHGPCCGPAGGSGGGFEHGSGSGPGTRSGGGPGSGPGSRRGHGTHTGPEAGAGYGNAGGPQTGRGHGTGGGAGRGGGQRRSRGMDSAYGPRWTGMARARRGNVRAALLALLAEQPMHGYQIIQELEERSSGMWRPSPGSIYPKLQLMTDEGLLSAEEQGGRRVYTITDAGREQVEARRQGGSRSPWQFEQPDREAADLRQAAFRLMGAVRQVGAAGSTDQRRRALALLDGARQSLYALLSEAEGASGSSEANAQG